MGIDSLRQRRLPNELFTVPRTFQRPVGKLGKTEQFFHATSETGGTNRETAHHAVQRVVMTVTCGVLGGLLSDLTEESGLPQLLPGGADQPSRRGAAPRVVDEAISEAGPHRGLMHALAPGCEVLLDTLGQRSQKSARAHATVVPEKLARRENSSGSIHSPHLTRGRRDRRGGGSAGTRAQSPAMCLRLAPVPPRSGASALFF